MLLLRQLFDVAGGGPETDAFKHLAAAFTVLRSLGSAKTSSNSESSRIVSIPRRYFNTVKLAGDESSKDRLVREIVLYKN